MKRMRKVYAPPLRKRGCAWRRYLLPLFLLCIITFGSITYRVKVGRESHKKRSSFVVGTDSVGDGYQTRSDAHRKKGDKSSTEERVSASRIDLINANEACRGKERLVKILFAAGMSKSDVNNSCALLPTWKEVVDLYGEDPIIHGLERCRQYRDLLSKDGMEPMVRIAGLFNTGTHLLAEALDVNVKPWDGVEVRSPYQVPWGKHVAASHKWESTIPWYNNESKSHVLPVVVVRDPLRWMASMCKDSYMAQWHHELGHCPNVVDSSGKQTYGIKVPYWKTNLTDTFDSLADMWSDWNRQYLEADYPRLVIRFEDQLFHAEKVMQLVTECAGLSIKGGRYKYLLEKAKGSARSSDFLSAISKYGTERDRYKCLTKADVKYMESALDGNIMDMFHYRHAPDSIVTSTDQLCPGQISETEWVDKKATWTEKEYRKDLKKRPWRRPDEFPDLPMSARYPEEGAASMFQSPRKRDKGGGD